MSDLIGEVGVEFGLPGPCTLSFSTGEGSWIFEITPEGQITFNREDYPNLTEDDFSAKVVEILETIRMKSYS